MRKILHPLQEEKARFLAARWHAACRGQAGTGKTLIWLRAAELVKAKSGLITCPAHVRRQWQKVIAQEWGAHHLKNFHVISYNEAIRRIFPTVENNDRVEPWRPHHRAFELLPKYDVWAGDEIHYLKTLDSRRTQAVFGPGGLVRRCRFKWPLSGTMAPNGRPYELYPMLKALAPGFRQSTVQSFAQRYCGMFYDGRGMRKDGATHLDELAEKLKDFMCHLTLKEMYPERKDPVVERVPLALTADDLKEIYVEEERIGARESTLSGSSRYEHFSQMGDTSRLLRLLANAKFRAAEDFITTTLTWAPKVIVFCRHVDLLERLNIHYTERSYNPVVLRGGLSDVTRDLVKNKFIYDRKCRVFLAQEDAAGTGTDGLQRVCSVAIDVEPSWTPGVTEQKLARLDRIGQAEEIVTYFLLYADGTLDEVKAVVHERKDKNVQRMERRGPRPNIDALRDFL